MGFRYRKRGNVRGKLSFRAIPLAAYGGNLSWISGYHVHVGRGTASEDYYLGEVHQARTRSGRIKWWAYDMGAERVGVQFATRRNAVGALRKRSGR